jgi:hypothetical protein
MTTFSFDQLARAVAYIARHAVTPEKWDAVNACFDDIKGRYARGALNLEQKRRLVAILVGAEV